MTTSCSEQVKSNPPLPSVYRARPQGPPGLPRQPVNNGAVGQPRPGGQLQQIRFDNRSPVGQTNPAQFVQVRPYGSPRSPGGSFPQKPPQQGQHPPIVLNPRFPPSPVQRSQLGPRPPHPGNYQAQRFQGNVQRPQHPRPEHLNGPHQSRPQHPNGPQQSRPEHPNGPYQQRPEHPNAPQQGRNPDILARSQEIAQKPLQRNESLLNISRQNLAIKREDKKPSLPRIIVDKMADVDNSKKLQQFEKPVSKEKAEFRESAENDDDDDVVMDRKSPRANGDVSSQEVLIESSVPKSDVQSAKRPEIATINGKVDNKLNATAEGVGQQIKEVAVNLDKTPVKDSNTMESDSRLSTKPGEEARTKLLDKQEVDKAGNQLDEPEKKLVEDQTQKEDTNKGNVTTAGIESKVEKSDDINVSVAPEQSPKKSEEAKSGQNEQNLNPSSTTSEKFRATTPMKSDEDNNQQMQILSKSTDKSPAKTSHDQSQQNLKPSASPNKSRSSTPLEASESQKELERDETSKPLEQLQEDIPMDTKKKQSDQELKNPPAASQVNSLATIPGEIKQKEMEQAAEQHDIVSASETKSDVDLLKETGEVKSKQESHLRAPMKADRIKDEPEPTETSKAEKSGEEEKLADLSHSPKEKELRDPSSKSPAKSTNATEESSTEDVLEDSKSDNLRDSSETHAKRVAVSPPASEKEASETQEFPVPSKDGEKIGESVLSLLKSPEEGVKGFDNGEQRSLSIKSSPSHSPRSPVSPKSPKSPKSLKSPVENEELEEKEKTEQKKADDETTPDTKSLPKSVKSPKVQRAPTPAKRKEKKSSTTPEVENGSVTNESAQSSTEPTTNGVGDSPTKKSPSKSKDADKGPTAGSPVKSPSKSVKSLPRTPETPSSTAGQEKKKLPMNKIQVGSAPSPNLKTVRSKIGSLENASYKPGGGKVKIENRKLDFSKAQPKIAAKNEKYTPSGGDKKIAQMKLQWNAKPKVGSLENATYKPGGGDKKIETVKLDFKDKAKPKVGSKDNAKHIPGGGSVKSSATPPKTPQDSNNDIQTQKIDIKAESKVGSLDNVKHKPGGGDKKIFNDRDYLRQSGTNPESLCGSGSQDNMVEEINLSTEQAKDDSPQPPPSTPTKAQKLASPSSMVTPQAVRNSLAKSPETVQPRKGSSALETIEVEDGNKENSSSEDKNVIKSRTARSPVNLDSLDSPQLKSPENRTAKLPISPRTLNRSELKISEEKTVKSSVSSRPSNSRSKSSEENIAKSPNYPRPPSSSSLKSSEDRAVKSPTSPRPPSSSSLKSPEDRAMKSPTSPRPSSSSLKSAEDRAMKSVTSPRPPSSSSLKSPEDRAMESIISPRPSSGTSVKGLEDKAMKSPNSPRPPNSLRLKSPDKSSSHMSRKVSPKELRLPKLAPSPTPQETAIVSEINTKISLPKLTERVIH
ncbi:microtubule-associated protein 2 isoform X2 [Bombus pyrosoma]|uniref:microtubule-associated protein 2 isoform X2 n=1 Tax=Bombus pyrosoma TaxID=396416 RepID=UPI001CB8AE51|nr:microtubule-associated protein 2 isoform X2 [Bombus pyrosoma]